MYKKLAWGAFFLAAIIGALIMGFFTSMHPGFVQTRIGTEVVQTSESASTTESSFDSSSTSYAGATVLQPTSTPPSNTAIPPDVHIYTNAELLRVAGNPYASGEVPLGDNKYVAGSAKKGYVLLCNTAKSNLGSQTLGPWIHGETWNYKQKIAVQGKNPWPSAVFNNNVYDAIRIITSHALPINHTTGTFPVASTDPARAYDANPNTISSHTLKMQVPINPVYNKIPFCMGGEVGILLTGVPLFNAFDAGLRDAPAHELQDSCAGHPQGAGEYHYHGVSTCIADQDVDTVQGFAYDGFPITGSRVAEGKYLTTQNLDECHGLVSDVLVDGKKRTTYHYVMTRDFPYSASCFRGRPVTTGPSAAPSSSPTPGPQTGGGSKPPKEAIDACTGYAQNAACSLPTPNGMRNGTCKNTPDGSFACVPN